MTYLHANSMKLNPKTQLSSTQLQIFKPNPPTKQQIKRAKFRDKTYYPPVRSGNNTSKSRGR